MKTVKLEKGERIIAAVPETCQGPGWRNEIVWVYIEDGANNIRRDCIQPEERTIETYRLFKLYEIATKLFISSIETKTQE